MHSEMVKRAGLAHEILRKAVGCWPFKRGTQRIPIELAKAFASFNTAGVIGSVGAGNVLFPFQPGDVAHPGYWFLYEKQIRQVMRRVLRPGSIFVDIGAHRGWHAGYALALVSPGGYVIAVEPHRGHAESLRRLAALNADKNLRVHEVAVADRTGEETLFVSGHEGWHTIVPEWNAVSSVPRSPVRVAAITLDDLLTQYSNLLSDEPARRILIKVDAEGAELAILKGATQTLRTPSVYAFIIELTGGPGLFSDRAMECIQVLRAAGRIPAVLTDRGRRPWEERDASRQVNILATRGWTL